MFFNPRVVFNFTQWHTLLRVQNKKSANKILGLVTHESWKTKIQRVNTLVGGFLRLRFEGRMTDKELVGQHTHTPIVDTGRVVLVINDLRSKVVECSTHGFAAVAGGVSRPAEISKLWLALEVHSNQK